MYFYNGQGDFIQTALPLSTIKFAVHSPHIISIGSAILAQHTLVTNAETNHATTLTTGRISRYKQWCSLMINDTHTRPFNDPLSGTTQVSQYQNGKTNLDFTEARDSEWQWHQLGHMQVCTSLRTDNHASTPPPSFYRPDALPATQPTLSKHWRHLMINDNDYDLQNMMK